MKLAANLPTGDANGIGGLARRLLDSPASLHVLVAVVDCKKATTDYDSGDVEPVMRIRRIEWVREDLDIIEKVMRRAMERRTGNAVLPFDLEDELRMVFAQINPETGEVLDGGDE